MTLNVYFQIALALTALPLCACGRPESPPPHTNAAARDAETEPDEIRDIPGFSSGRVPDPVFGGEIYLLKAGPETAPPLLLVHGIGARGSADWYPVLAGLSAHFRVFAPDLPDSSTFRGQGRHVDTLAM